MENYNSYIKYKFNKIFGTNKFQELCYTSCAMCDEFINHDIDKSPIHYTNSLTRMSVTRVLIISMISKNIRHKI